jgi:hypothetical protein
MSVRAGSRPQWLYWTENGNEHILWFRLDGNQAWNRNRVEYIHYDARKHAHNAFPDKFGRQRAEQAGSLHNRIREWRLRLGGDNGRP